MSLPSAQPEQQWIPCSERLPEKEGKYLVTVRWSPNGKFRVDVVDYGHKVDDAWLEKEWLLSGGSAFGERWGDTIDNIEETLAWMPLPEPWRGEDNDS